MELSREEAVKFFNNLDELINNLKKDIEKTDDLSVEAFPTNNLFRAFHSIKVNANILGYEQLSNVCQLAGDVILKIRIGSLKFDDNVREILIKTTELLSTVSENLKNDGCEQILEQSSIPALIRDLTQQVPSSSGIAASDQSRTGIHVVYKDDRKKPEKLKSLVVEDEFVSRNMLLDFLSDYGQCDVAINGSEAVAAFKEALKKRENSYNLICMDIMMPETDGMEAARMIRQLEAENGVPAYAEVNIIMITALGDPKTVINSYYNCGATSYLVKPINLKRLKVELEKLGII